MLQGPEYRNRSTDAIISEDVYFDSVGHTYRALSWLDIAKRNRNVSAFQYATLEVRLAIENLMFEEILMSVGHELDKAEYEKCKGSSTKLKKILRRLSPDYEKLVEFTRIINSVNPNAPPLISWDHGRLMKLWGKVSDFLHWQGTVDETYDSAGWFEDAIKLTEEAALHIWENLHQGYSGVLMPAKMQPEIRDYWEKFRNGKVDAKTVERIAGITLPVLNKRIRKPGNT